MSSPRMNKKTRAKVQTLHDKIDALLTGHQDGTLGREEDQLSWDFVSNLEAMRQDIARELKEQDDLHAS